MSAEAEIKQFIERILRLKEEQDTLGEDIREVYAEAKGRGYDKAAMGQVVAHIRKLDKVGQQAIAEKETIFEIYFSAYQGASHAHTHAHTHADAGARENIEQFTPEVAKIITTPEQSEVKMATVDPIPTFLRPEIELRPHCQQPNACAGYGRNHCYSCKKMIAEVAQ